MQKTLAELADLVQGELCGDPSMIITGVASIPCAGAQDITFAESEQYLGRLSSCQAAASIVPPHIRPSGIAYVVVEDVRASMDRIASLFRNPPKRSRIGISPTAHVSSNARIAEHVDIHPGAVIGDEVEIGRGSIIQSGVHILPGSRLAEDVILMPNVVVYENTVIGPRVVIHSGAVIGAYGFGYDQVNGEHVRSAQLGYVEIEADVEIGACTTIDRGTYGATFIGAGTKIDNQVMIAHNCCIGRRNIICSQVGIAGSVTTGDFCVFAGQVGIRDHVHIGHRVSLAAKAGVISDVPDDEVFIGIPATPAKLQLQILATQHRLPEVRKQFKQLQRNVDAIQRKLDAEPRSDAA